MGNNLFSDDGHVATWVFYPSAWGGEDYWASSFPEEEKLKIFDHMKVCNHCREAEIEATLKWAELRPRTSHTELLPVMMQVLHTPIIDIHNFDRYPAYLLDKIMPFIKGKSVLFTRSPDGQLQIITGILNGVIESSCKFIHTDESVAIHSFCHNREDDCMDENCRVTFSDFHLRLVGNELHCTQDVADFIPSTETIGREHHRHKIIYNNDGLPIKIFNLDEQVYEAHYDSGKRLVYENRNGVIVEQKYEADRLVSRKVCNHQEILENRLFEYAAAGIGPVREFDISETGHHLSSLNTYMDNDNDGFSIDLLHDGVARRYYNKSGQLLGKILLPDDPAKLGKEPDISNVKEILEVFDTIEVVMVDRESLNVRFIQKCAGKLIVDQTAIYENGYLAKLYNHSESARNTCHLSMFSGRHWNDITQNNDPIF